jgi:hypothetical protein
MGWIPHLSTYCQMHVGSYGYVPSCQVHEAATSRGPEWAMLIHMREAPGHTWPGGGSLPWVDERGRRGRWVVKSWPSVLIIGWRSDDRGSFLGLVLFRLVAPPLQLRVMGQFPDMRCMILQPFAAEGNRSYLEFWTLTGSPWFSGYLPDMK